MSTAYEKAIQDAVLAQCAPAKALEPAAEVLRSAVLAGAKDPSVKAAAGEFIRQTVSGAVKGLLLAEVDLSAAALKLLNAVAEAANEAGLDPGEAMTWGIEGIARCAKLIPTPVLQAMKEELEAAFMGVGDMFADFCKAALEAHE